MAFGPARRGRPKRAPDEIAPTEERLGHGDVARVPAAVADEDGRPARPYRAADSLARMVRNGTISPAMQQAADDFRAIFRRAALDPLRAPDLRRMPGGGQGLQLDDHHADARRKVARALDAAGGIASPGGSCLWHVVGCEWTVRQWAARAGWGGRRLSEETAAGVLVAALGVLQALYGL